MDMNKIKLFHDVAGFSSFSEAARALKKSQPAISQQIMSLEESLGFKLFLRGKRTISLSAEGQMLRTSLSCAFGDIYDAVSQLQGALNQQVGSIDIAMLLDGSTNIDIVTMLSSFKKEFPNIDINMEFGSNKEIESKILSQSVDFGVSILFQEKKLLERKQILQETHVFCVSNRHSKLSVLELIESQLVIDFADEYPCFQPWLRKNYGKAKLHHLKKKKPSILVPNHYEAIKILESNWGAAILPKHLLNQIPKKSKIAPYSKGCENLTVGLDLAWLKNKTLSVYEKKFVDFFTIL